MQALRLFSSAQGLCTPSPWLYNSTGRSYGPAQTPPCNVTWAPQTAQALQRSERITSSPSSLSLPSWFSSQVPPPQRPSSSTSLLSLPSSPSWPSLPSSWSNFHLQNADEGSRTQEKNLNLSPQVKGHRPTKLLPKVHTGKAHECNLPRIQQKIQARQAIQKNHKDQIREEMRTAKDKASTKRTQCRCTPKLRANEKLLIMFIGSSQNSRHASTNVYPLWL